MIYSTISSFFIASLALFSSSTYAQKEQNFRITIGENLYQINYSPETQDVLAVARNFCITQQSSLGYTETNPLTEANIGNCIQPIAQELQRLASLNAKTQATPVNPPAPSGDLYSVRVPANGQLFEIRFRPDSEPFERVAAEFCINQQAALGFNETNPLTQENVIPSCIRPIASYLQNSVKNYQQKQTTGGAVAAPPAAAAASAARQPLSITVRVPVEGKVFEIILRDGQNVADIARQFCIEQHLNLGFSETNPLTDANIGGCVNPIATYLSNSVNQFNQQQQAAAAAASAAAATTGAGAASSAASSGAASSGVATIPVTIDNKEYQISFKPGSETIEQVSRNFCIQNGGTLGLTQETVMNCVGVVGNYLMNLNRMNTK